MSIQPISQEYNLASYIIYVACINFIYKFRHLKFKFLLAILYTLTLFARNLPRDSHRKAGVVEIFNFCFVEDIWCGRHF